MNRTNDKFVCGLIGAGYLFGNLPWVQQHLSKIIWALIIVPGLIAIFGAWKARRNEAPESSPVSHIT